MEPTGASPMENKQIVSSRVCVCVCKSVCACLSESLKYGVPNGTVAF